MLNASQQVVYLTNWMEHSFLSCINTFNVIQEISLSSWCRMWCVAVILQVASSVLASDSSIRNSIRFLWVMFGTQDCFFATTVFLWTSHLGNILLVPDPSASTSWDCCRPCCWQHLLKPFCLPGITWQIFCSNHSVAFCWSVSHYLVTACWAQFRGTWN